ncbi:MAG: heparinase II/III family protein, partial [Anaerolineae bacterium]
TGAVLGQTAVPDGSVYLPDIAWMVNRCIVDGKTIAFSAKGGHNAEPHNHNDLGHFILHLGGESLLADLGAGVYTRQYFGPERYEALHTGSQGHSVPVINGMGQGNGRSYTATVLNYQSQPDGVVFALDLTHAYPETAELHAFTRSFDWSVDVASRSAELRLVDAFHFGGETAVVEECFISLKPPTLAKGTAVWRVKQGTITLQFDSNHWEPIFDTIASQTHAGEMITVYRLRLRIQALNPNQLEAVFTFTCQLQDEPQFNQH